MTNSTSREFRNAIEPSSQHFKHSNHFRRCHVRSNNIHVFRYHCTRADISHFSSNPFTTVWRTIHALGQFAGTSDGRSVIEQGKRERNGRWCSVARRGEEEEGR